MKYPKLRELREAIKAIIRGPYTTRYPKEPLLPYERFRGRPYFHDEDCTGCTACAQVCPATAIEVADKILKDGRALRTLSVRWDICICCGQCQANCLTGKGIILSREFDYATCGKREELKNSVEKEFLLCESCHEPVLPHEQYKWVANKLGPLLFSNASLILFYLRSLGVALKDRITGKLEDTEFLRSSRTKILCPKCRRQAVLKS